MGTFAYSAKPKSKFLSVTVISGCEDPGTGRGQGRATVKSSVPAGMRLGKGTATWFRR
ncbi:MAG: hypothetical protein RLZZ265_2053 [Verrucomicrobiota bacterium]|jgi:hypothetical protein